MNKLSIVIPAKNEEKRINKALSLYGSFFDSHKGDLETEIIVVVNNSTDKTSLCVDEYSEKYTFIKKIETTYSSGKGGAVAFGFQKAAGDFIGFTDADGSVSPSEFFQLYKFLEETPWLDGVVGKRDPKSFGLLRGMLNSVYIFWFRLLFNFPYHDVQCGAKIFRKKPAQEISKKLFSTGWAFDTNILLIAKYLNLRVMEHHVDWVEKAGSKLSFWQGLVKLPYDLLRLKIKELSHIVTTKMSRLRAHKRHKPERGRKNILIFSWRDIKHPEMGGAEIYIHNIAERLAKKHNVTIFTSKPDVLADEDEINGVKIIRRGGFLSVYVFAFLYYVLYFRHDMDFIIDIENGIPFFSPLFSRKPKVLLIHHVHASQWFKQFPLPVATIGYLLERFIMPLLYRKTPVITVSPSSLREILSLGFKDSRVFMAYSAVYPTKYKDSRYSNFETPLLVYLGRLKAYKRVELAIKAVKSLEKKYPDLNLIICGSGDHEQALKEMARKEKLANKVIFKGFVSEREKWKYYQQAWINLLPSIKEGWGITIIEAAACGTPTVGFDTGGVRDSILNNQTGFLASDQEDFVRKIDLLLSDKKLGQKMGEKCVMWSKAFSWKEATQVFEQVMNSQFGVRDLLSDKTYPWELDLRAESITSLIEM